MILKRERLSPAEKRLIIQRFQILCLSTICNVQLPTSYLGPALITGQDSSVQNSVMVPYNMLIWLKKSTVFTATHLDVVMLFEIRFFFILLVDVFPLRQHHS